MLESLQLSPWPATAVVALFAITLAAIAHRIVALILRRATSPLPVVHKVVLACIPVMRVLLPLIALQLVWQAASDELPAIGGVRHLNGLAVIAGACWLLIAAIGGLANGVIAQHPADVGRQPGRPAHRHPGARALAHRHDGCGHGGHRAHAHDLSGGPAGGRQPARIRRGGGDRGGHCSATAAKANSSAKPRLILRCCALWQKRKTKVRPWMKSPKTAKPFAIF